MDVVELARGIVVTVEAAAGLAHRRAVEVTAALMPKYRDPADTDLAFVPVLDEPDRLIAHPPQLFRGWPAR